MVEKRRIHSYFRVLVFLCVCVCLKSQKNKNKIKSPTIIGSQMYTIIIQYNVAIVMTSNGKKNSHRYLYLFVCDFGSFNFCQFFFLLT